MNTWKSVLLGLVLGLLISGAILLIAMPPRGQPLILTPPPTVSTTIMIYITGAVQSPGVYTLSRPARVNDAVLAAGGLLPSADPASVNLAAKIDDGAKIVIQSLNPSTSVASNDPNSKPSPTPHLTPTIPYPIDINTATESLLDALPGIGPSKAAAIVTYRQEHGPFAKIEDIQNVPGIGIGLFNSMKDLITVNSEP
jgi:competence protein ComEA